MFTGSVTYAGYIIAPCIPKWLDIWVFLFWHSSWAVWLFNFQAGLHAPHTCDIADHRWIRLGSNHFTTISISHR